jgi:ribosomal protein S18 acetylase RimI-like enzyme
MAVYGSDAMLGLLYFGQRGNLIIVGCESVDPRLLARAINDSLQVWRIAMGPAAAIASLGALETKPALVDREQLYYAIKAGEPARECLHSGVRPAGRKDLRKLFDAALDLNSSDLNVADWRVNKSWLRESIKRRVRAGNTLVIGEPGEVECKVDIGSIGLAGVMLEGVYTRPQARGRGLATALVATAAEDLLADNPLVALHVDSDNLPARKAYEAAGMSVAGSCRLFLRD